MKVLVTGGSGYIGSVLVSELLQKGYAVKVFDKLYFGKEHLDKGGYGSRIELIQGDIRKIDKSVLDDVGSVIHMAGLSNDPTAEFNPKANMEMNREGTKSLAGACIEKGINVFTYASTASIYDRGLRENSGLLDEETTVEPIAAYSESKFEGEKVLLELADKNPNFCPVILRQGTVYGQSPRMRYDLVINTMVKSAFVNNRIRVNCGGSQWRPLVDVRDVARAHIACLEAKVNDIRGEIFNIIYENYQILDLAHRVKESIKDIQSCEVDVDYREGRIDRSYKISKEKFEEKLKFRYRVPVEDSARNMAQHIKNYLSKGGKVTDLDNPIYYNIKWMEHLVDMEKRLKQMGGNVF